MIVSTVRPSPRDAAIEVAGVCFDYANVRALNEVSFTVERGSVTALVGPNGAGKTTLMRCLAALERPLLGSIRVAGVDVLEEPRACHRRIGFLSDTYGLYEALTVAQCLTYAALSKGMGAGEVPDTVVRTAERLDITNKLEARAGELSRGQRQRVAIGQALIHSPQVLILDEPASGLDPEAREVLARLLTRLQGEGMTLLVSSHILAELDAYSTHMLVLRDGRVIDNRTLGGPAVAGARVRVALAAPVMGWQERARGCAGVQVVEADGSNGVLLVAGGDRELAATLKFLVEAGLPVAGFHAERENLQDSYLRTVRQEGGQ